MQGSRDKLKDVLQDKLLNYESGVTREMSDAILARVQAARNRGGMIRKALYSTGFLITIGSLYYYSQVIGPVTNAKYATASVASAIADGKASIGGEKTSSTPGNEASAMSSPGKDPGKTITATPAASNIPLNNRTQEVQPTPTLVHTEDVTTSQLVTHSVEHRVELAAAPSETGVVSIVEEKAEEPLSELANESIAPKSESAVPADRFSISMGFMPTLNYKRLVPNGCDAAYLHDFETPSSLHKSRLGFTTSLLAQYSFKNHRSIYGGLGFFTYQSQFTYSSSEVASSVSAVNTVDKTHHGLSLLAGLKLPLWPGKVHRYNLNLGGQLQLPKSGTQFVAQAGFEYGRKLSHGMLTIQPMVFYAVTPIHYSGLIAYPYGGGIDLRYELPLGLRD